MYTVANEATPAAILRAALKNLKANGWYKGEYRQPGGRAVCALGAINAAMTGNPEDEVIDTTYNNTVRYLKNAGGIILTGIPSWNDDSQRKSQDVITVFRKAITLAEKESSECPTG